MDAPQPLLEILVKASDTTVIARRELMAERVIASFDALPNRRLLCFFDDKDCLNLKEDVGLANRGLYTPVRSGDPLWRLLPDDVRQYVLFGNHPAFPMASAPAVRAFDHLVYLHGSTCSNEVGLTMTFAHEVQHFVQHESALVLWAANTVAVQTLIHGLNKSEVIALGLQWCDIPIEREARIVSKRTAEILFGVDAVRQYIDAKIDEFVTEQDAADWKCIRDLDASARYDLAAETKLFFPKLKDYRSRLATALQHLSRNDRDFKDVDLDELLSGNSV